MSESTGVIHDIGYRHYDGARLGRGRAVLALTVHSLRGVFGLGRTARAKIIPFLLVGVMMLPAVVSIAIMAVVKQKGLGYTEYAAIMQAVLAIFLASQAPYTVAPDLRFRVLPLYLSRPVTLVDYVGAKLAAMTTAMFLLLAVPLTVLFIGEMLIDLPGDTPTAAYLTSMAGAVCYAVLLACIGVAIASFTPRRGLGVASVIAFYLLTSAVSTVLFATMESMGNDTAAAWAWLINPFFLVDAAVQVGIFGAKPAQSSIYPSGAGTVVAIVIMLALIALSVTALIMRYRKAASR
ncbi:ABC transporter permease [Streptosporangium sp. 'caverna']|jgi:ABC-2 type transport system permease protein|uniref:ABC transporter permease n=1 Tax=Streptosporangium TaxID=2000 RepID=UPI000D7DA6E6|nr:ABC transporter permease [Streptosporangium sp. 'caverna']AWS40602.1 ABC transporter permease [Streptosporangium sp. 'caverna']WSA16120.1 ABC transporter permease [Streptosporangium subroseum]